MKERERERENERERERAKRREVAQVKRVQRAQILSRREGGALQRENIYKPPASNFTTHNTIFRSRL